MPNKSQTASPASTSGSAPEVESNNTKAIKGWYLWLVQLIQRISGTLPEHVRESLIESLNQKSPEEELANSKKDAVNRLKMVILQDRTNLSSEEMDGLRGDLITTISKYVEVDQETLEVQLEQQMNRIALVANVSMIRSSADIESSSKSEDATETVVQQQIVSADMPDEIDDLVEMELEKEAQKTTKKSS